MLLVSEKPDRRICDCVRVARVHMLGPGTVAKVVSFEESKVGVDLVVTVSE